MVLLYPNDETKELGTDEEILQMFKECTDWEAEHPNGEEPSYNELRNWINRVGECPFCGSLMLDYGALETANQDIYYPWTCTHCGASGREVYELSFAGHYQCVSPNGEYFEEIDNN